MTTRQPVAYIRRSKVEAGSPGDVSRDTQLAAIRARASIDGHNGDMVILEDWGKSGRRSKVDKREGYARLREMVEQGTVSTIYAYNWSRLGRSTRDLLELADQCKAQGTAIVTATGQSVDPTTADGRMLLTILTAVDEWQAEVQAERTTGVLAAWREAHPDQRLGRKPYGTRDGEDPAVVVAAFEEAGSYLGTCKLLSERHVPTRMGAWNVRTVKRIIERERPGTVPMGGRQGARAIGRHLFSGLVYDSLGHPLTTMPRAGSVGYWCRVAHHDPTHPRPYVVSERKLLGPAMAEAAHFRYLTADYGDEATEAERQALIEDRRLVGVALRLRTMTEAEAEAEVARIDAEIAKLDLRGRIVDIPPVAWNGDPAAANTSLRAMWERIILGPDLLPVRFVWRDEGWRAD